MNRFRIFIFFILLITIALGNPKSYAQETLKFSKPGPLDYHAQISEEILKEAYNRIGITVTTIEFPGERALRQSNSGNVDGEVNRIQGIKGKYPNLRIVPVAINALKGYVFTKNQKIRIKDWESIRPFKIGLRIGAKYAEYGTADMDFVKAASNELVFRMLDRGRVDVAISTELEGSLTIQKLELEGISLMEPPLVTLDLFHFLHKKHILLVPLITNALEAMAREGRIQKIRNDALNRFNN